MNEGEFVYLQFSKPRCSTIKKLDTLENIEYFSKTWAMIPDLVSFETLSMQISIPEFSFL